MYFVYNLAVLITSFFLKILAPFNSKIKLFIKGRKATFANLEASISKNDMIIWVHTASLGEFEQGLPVIERLRVAYPEYKVLLTFFSPSGFEVKKDSTAADYIQYLPLDSRQNARRFVALVQPKLAVFVKYEIWPNYLKALEQHHVPIILISAIFKKDQIYFKWYGKFMRNVLRKLTHFFVQNSRSEQLLNSLGINNVTISGDTRFDRVAEIREQENTLSFVADFKLDATCVVAGSTWPEDEKILVPFINNSTEPIKFVIAPHNIKKEQLQNLKKLICKKTVLFSELNNRESDNYDVLIVDAIGLLTKIYSYADIAYVGGGFATGLHNTLEPAVFGIPVVIGPNYSGFKEAEDLIREKGIYAITSAEEFKDIINGLLNDQELYQKTASTNWRYINKNKGASIQIIQHIRTLL